MIFVDTWAWLALAYAKDPYHARAVDQHRRFQLEGRRYLTTDFIVNELISSLFSVSPFDEARRFVDGLFRSLSSGRHELAFVTPEQFQAAYALRLKFRDKPDISFVDLTSFAVMQDRKIAGAFTGDSHYLKVGMGFRLYP